MEGQKIETADDLWAALRSGEVIAIGMERACILSREMAAQYSSKVVRELWIKQGCNRTVARALAAIPRNRTATKSKKSKKKGGA